MKNNFIQFFYDLPEKLLFQKKYRWVSHTLFWLFMYFDEVLSFLGVTGPIMDMPGFLFALLTDIVLVYFNIYFLLPNFLNRKKFPIYIFGTIASLLFMMAINYIPFGGEYGTGTGFISDNFAYIIMTLGILGPAVALKIIKNHINEQAELGALTELQTKTELNFLKQQVNPHFLFNNLNSIYVQSKKETKNVSETILQLSDLLRYQIYDGTKDRVPLKEEIKFLEGYIAMEKLRRENLKVRQDVEGNIAGYSITPLLVLPLIENAFKHGQMISGEEAYINIAWTTSTSKIKFYIENSKGDAVKKTDEYKGGIGLENIKRRLELAYPDRYKLYVNEDLKTYKVLLTLES